MTEPSPSQSAIYARLIESGACWAAPERWREVCEPEARVLPDPAAALAILQAEFRTSALVEAGVVIAPASGTIQLTAGLASPGALLILLRRSADEPPFDVLTNAGCLTGRLPVLQALRELQPELRSESESASDVESRGEPGHHDVTDSDIDEDNDEDDELTEQRLDYVFVAGSLEDAALLRGLGLTAVPTGHLADVRRHDVRELFAGFGARDDRAHDDGAQPPGLVFVDWSVADLAATSQLPLEAIRDHFANLDRHLGRRLAECFVWRPSAGDLDSLAFALEFGDLRDVQRGIWASIDAGSHSLMASPSSLARVVTPTDNPVEAARQVSAVRRRNGDRDIARQAWQNLETAHETTFVEPLLVAASQQRDPLDGALLASFTDTARLRHLCAVQLTEQLRHSIERDGLLAAASLSDDAVHRLGKLSDQMLDAARELRRRLGPQRVLDVTPVRPRPLVSGPRSPAADEPRSTGGAA